MATEPLLDASQVALELLGFAGAFAASGSIGYRYAVLRGRMGAAAPPAEGSLLAGGAARSALVGLGGLLVGAGLLASRLPGLAARRHVTLVQLVTGDAALLLQVGLTLLGLVGFALAARRLGIGWALAALAVVALPLRGLTGGNLLRLVNPLHELAGGLWIGTLLQMVVIGIGSVRRSRLPAERKGTLVAEMVRAFSPLALGAFVLLGSMGVITAWRHLKRLDALWTTPYGYALLVKLALVAGVLAFGAHNWKRLTPTLGAEAAAGTLQRSARGELLLAGLVLIVTAVLVSLPSPR